VVEVKAEDFREDDLNAVEIQMNDRMASDCRPKAHSRRQQTGVEL